MTDHPSVGQLDGYRRRTLSPDQLLEVGSHLAACEACRNRAGGEPALAAAFAGARRVLEDDEDAQAHLRYEDLEAYLDGGLDAADRQAVVAHLEGCAACATDAADLGAFRGWLSNSGSLREAAAFPVAPSPPPARLRWWTRLPLQLLGTAAAAALAAWAVSLSLRSEVQSLGGRVADLEGTNARLVAALGEAKTPAVAELADGSGIVTLDANGRPRGLPALPPWLMEAVSGALATRRIEAPARLAEWVGRPETLMGDSGDGVPFALLQPVGVVVESDRPTFRWRPLPGAESYLVAVYDAQLRRVASSGPLRVTEWAPARPLTRNAVHSWQVTATRGGQEVTSPTAPAPEARFQVLGRRELEELRDARSTYGDWKLVMAVVYARAGLVREAEGALRELAAANPGSPLVRDLQKSLAAPR